MLRTKKERRKIVGLNSTLSDFRINKDLLDRAGRPVITKEQWLKNALDSYLRDIFLKKGYSIGAVDISITMFPRRNGVSKTIGRCSYNRLKEDGVCTIEIDYGKYDNETVMGVFIHELIHSCLGHDVGHGSQFRKACDLLGLKGGFNGRSATSYTATVPDNSYVNADGSVVNTGRFNEMYGHIFKELGDYPHGEINEDGKRKTKKKQVRVVCPHCNFNVMASHRWSGNVSCGACSEELGELIYCYEDDTRNLNKKTGTNGE